jgi:hypothetical protein
VADRTALGERAVAAELRHGSSLVAARLRTGRQAARRGCMAPALEPPGTEPPAVGPGGKRRLRSAHRANATWRAGCPMWNPWAKSTPSSSIGKAAELHRGPRPLSGDRGCGACGAHRRRTTDLPSGPTGSLHPAATKRRLTSAGEHRGHLMRPRLRPR